MSQKCQLVVEKNRRRTTTAEEASHPTSLSHLPRSIKQSYYPEYRRQHLFTMRVTHPPTFSDSLRKISETCYYLCGSRGELVRECRTTRVDVFCRDAHHPAALNNNSNNNIMSSGIMYYLTPSPPP